MVVDIGTGDGLFVYQSARRNPDTFYIGVDANARPLEKVSERIYRRPARGGVLNALFVQAPIGELPPELNGIAGEVRVHFPWGSLLKAVAKPEESSLQSLRRLCSPSARLVVIIGLDTVRDHAEMQRLGLALISVEYIDSTLTPGYKTCGFEVLEEACCHQRNGPHSERPGQGDSEATATGQCSTSLPGQLRVRWRQGIRDARSQVTCHASRA